MTGKSFLFLILAVAAVAVIIIYLPDKNDPPIETAQQNAPPPLVDAVVENNISTGEGSNQIATNDETEMVGNVEVRKDRDCTVKIHYLPNADGTVTEAYSCVPNSPRESHPYESYSNEALSQLAYSDAKAAEILGMRLSDQDEELALSMVIRASALSGGDATPILAFSNAYRGATMIDGVPVEETIHTRYVLSAVAKLLGAEGNNYDYWHTIVIDTSDSPSETLAGLDANAHQILEEMQAIEAEVLGEPTIEVPDDA